MAERTIQVEALCRVEGEGGLHIRLRDGAVQEVELRIFEPPRLFEAFLRGRPLEEVPDITARICGICPVAYQMSSVHALEAALGVTISPEVRALRRLLYCGEWIESHALHIHLLHAPDYLGYESGLAMARDYPNEVRRGLTLKKVGNELLEILGGRAIHPVNVAVGGFYRAPRRDELQALIPAFEQGLADAIEMTRWLATLPMPQLERDYDFVALVHPDEYALSEGEIVSSRGDRRAAAAFGAEYQEIHVPHSTALQARRISSGTCYFVGPLARLALSRDRLTPAARQLADELKFPAPCRNPFLSIVARGIELVFAYEEALGILRNYRPPKPSRASYAYRDGTGSAATEAPRGLLFHRYTVDAAGHVVEAQIVPPTSQNQAQIEDDLRAYLPAIMDRDDRATTLACEHLVRNYDPCISCSTHFLKVSIDRG